MVKILGAVLAAIVIAVGGYFGFEFYVQQRVASEVEAAFAGVRASGAKASHGKVSFDLWTRTIAVADIAGESAAQPPVSVKIGRFTAAGVAQPDANRFSADSIDAENVEVGGTLPTQGGLRISYQAPRINVAGYSGPAGPMRPLDTASTTDIYRFVLEHFGAVTATSITAPAITASMTGAAGGSPLAGSGDYTYSGLALRDLKDGKIAAMTADRMSFAAIMGGGAKNTNKNTKMTGEISDLAVYDFDAAASAAILDPARTNDDKYYRAYRQVKAGAYTMSSDDLKVRIEGFTADDIGIRPSRLQLPTLLAIIEAAPPPGATPNPAQLRDMLDKVAGIYEGIRIGSAEVRGLSTETPEGPFKLAAIRLTNLENGKIGELAIEGLEARSPNGPVKLGRFALKALDVANLLRMSSQFSAPGQKPSPDQLVALLLLLEGTEIKNLLAPHKSTGQPISIDTLTISWGQFVGPIPTTVRSALRMSGPVEMTDPEPFKMLAAAGISNANVNLDFGAAWNEGTRAFAVEPATIEIGGVLSAAARLTFANVARETFSVNPLQAVFVAGQIEVGALELALRDNGGVDLLVAQNARTQKVSREAARRALVESVKTAGMTMAAANPDAMAIAGAITRFIENPRGTVSVKLTPRGKVAMMELVDTLRSDPLAALARFQVDATTGR